jgi:hypothetical protein
VGLKEEEPRGGARSGQGPESPRDSVRRGRGRRGEGEAREDLGDPAEAGARVGTSFEQILVAHSVFLKSGRAGGLKGQVGPIEGHQGQWGTMGCYNRNISDTGH